jgi:hypothetical protein
MSTKSFVQIEINAVFTTTSGKMQFRSDVFDHFKQVYSPPEPVVHLWLQIKRYGFNPHSDQSQPIRSQSIVTDKIVLVVQSYWIPTPPFPGMVVPACRITKGGCGR